MSHTSTARKGAAAVAALAALALGGSAIAGAATSTSKSSSKAASGTTGAGARAHSETALTGARLKSASDAAIAANAGAKVDRASTEDPADANGAAYEVKITKADGTRAEVLEDSSSFKVLSTKADTGHGGRGHGGNANEKALTGDDLAKATAAAKSAVPGGTVERASTEDAAENSGAAYEVHVTKADGSRVTVLLNSAFSVTKTVADNGHGGR